MLYGVGWLRAGWLQGGSRVAPASAEAKLQRWGCRALRTDGTCLACRDAACKQAVVNGGAVVAVVAAIGQHTADAELQRYGCGALWELACALARSAQPSASLPGKIKSEEKKKREEERRGGNVRVSSP